MKHTSALTISAGLSRRPPAFRRISYLTARRIEHAKELLATGEILMSEIALEIGFSGHANLTDCFHRLVGVTPREFRQLKLKVLL